MLTTTRRGTVSLCLIAASALALSACVTSREDATTVVDLSNSSEVAALCGPQAHDVANSFSRVLASLTASAAEREEAINNLKNVWKLEDPTDKASVQLANDTLQERAKAVCATPSPSASSSPSPTPTASATLAACQTWELKRSDYGPNSRWFADGIIEIKNAKTKAQARKAINVWLDQTKTDPGLFAGAAQFFLDKKVDQAGLFKDNCATPEAVNLLTEMTLELALADMTPDTAPANGVNTGASTNGVHRSSQRGITGDRTAIKVKRKNGKIVWIMWRCGNAVTIEFFNLPKGKTDNPPPPPPPPPVLDKKKIREAPQYNPEFPEQQKPNPLPATPSQKQTKKPTPPPPVYTPPPPPPAPKPTPRPSPPPPPEPPAPEPTDPGTGGSCAPGIPSC